MEGVRLLGPSKWAEIKKLAVGGIAGLLATRSAVDLKDKWRNLVRARWRRGGAEVAPRRCPTHDPLARRACLRAGLGRFHRRFLPHHPVHTNTTTGPPAVQTRVAKLPKSVLKARAHKSTSDIPLDLLLTGKPRPVLPAAPRALCALCAMGAAPAAAPDFSVSAAAKPLHCPSACPPLLLQ